MSEFEVKNISVAESVEYSKLSCMLFRVFNEKLNDPEKLLKEREQWEKEQNFDVLRMGALYEGKLCACLTNYVYTVNFDGTPCKMSGVGGVVSDFNTPKRGAVKEIYKKLFEEIRKEKQYIAHLYPFEESYYRQFGYEVSAQKATWSIPADRFDKAKRGQSVYYDGSDKMKNDIKSVYNEFSKDKNLIILKDENDWQKFFEQHAAYQDKSKFVHYNENGVADAFLEYTIKEYDNKPQDMEITTLWYTSIGALKGVLSYFNTQISYCDRVFVPLNANVDISAFVNSMGGFGKRNVERTIVNGGTTRIVDVEEILKLANIKGEGEVCIKINNDIYAPWNNGCFKVKSGKVREVIKGDFVPDIEMDINAFSSGILGRYDLEGLKIFDTVKINSNEENLKKVFYLKTVWTETHF